MNITIYLQDNNTINATVEGYSSTEYAAKFNDPRVLMISIGDIVLNKNHVKMIAPTPIEQPTV